MRDARKAAHYGFEELFKRNEEAWRKRWAEADVLIKGEVIILSQQNGNVYLLEEFKEKNKNNLSTTTEKVSEDPLNTSKGVSGDEIKSQIPIFDISLSIQFILNCGASIAGSCLGGKSKIRFQQLNT